MLHMLTHLPHLRVFSRQLTNITGATDAERRRELAAGKSFAEIGAEHGHSLDQMRTVLVRAARSNAKRSVRLHASSRAQARRWQIAEERGLVGFLTWKRPTGGAARPAPGGTPSGGGLPGLPVPATSSRATGYSFLCRH